PADGVGFEPTRAIHPTRFPIVRLKPLGHPSETSAGRSARPAAPPARRSGEGGIRTLEGLLGPNALAGRRLKPLGHLSGNGGGVGPPSDPSKVAPPGFEPGLSGSGVGGVANSTRGHPETRGGGGGPTRRPSVWELEALPPRLPRKVISSDFVPAGACGVPAEEPPVGLEP